MNPRPRASATGRFVSFIIAALLLAAPASAQRVRQISEFLVQNLDSYAVDDAGTVGFYCADVDPLGTNPNLFLQVFKVEFPGGALSQVTAFDADVESVSVSDDGSTLLFVSHADPLGTNHDRGGELFLSGASGGSLVQLTDLARGAGDVLEARLSGDGDSALFLSDADITGGNPSGVVQIFLADTGGGGITQVTAAATAGSIADFAVSDDGTRLAFLDDRDLTGGNPDGSLELYRILTDGTGLTQLTSADVYHEVNGLAISGDGSRIAYTGPGGHSLYSILWGSTKSFLHDDYALQPSLTDDGLEVYYAYNGDGVEPPSLRKTALPTGTPEELWTDSEPRAPVVSGSGSRLLFRLQNENQSYFGSPYARGLMTTDGAGQSPMELVDVGEAASNLSLDMTPDGSRVVMPWGYSGITGAYEVPLWVIDVESATSTLLPCSGVNPTISDDGNAIVFRNWYEDLVPAQCPGIDGGVYRIDADGTGLLELAPNPTTCDPAPFYIHPAIAGNGGAVVFQSSGTGIGAQLWVVNAAGGPITQVTNDDDSLIKLTRIDGTGTWTVYQSHGDPLGQNPDELQTVFRVRTDGTGLEQILPGGGAAQADVSADGETIVFLSGEDPFGTNSDLAFEVFLYDTGTSSLEQLTETTDCSFWWPRISGNARYVVFSSDCPFVSGSLGTAAYRIDLLTGELRLASAGGAWEIRDYRLGGNTEVSNHGAVAFFSAADLVRRNPDGSEELWLAEFDTPPRIEPSVEHPTAVFWDPLPWALRYDVIRGDVANLTAGVGGTVDLGPVVCLEDDSIDATTVGFEDVAEPAAGEVFFYLLRPWGGELVDAETWGEGSGGAERVPSSGSCL